MPEGFRCVKEDITVNLPNLLLVRSFDFTSFLSL